MTDAKNLKHVAKGGLIFTIGRMSAFLMKLVIGVVVIRYITRSEYGMITFGYVLANIFVVLAALGFKSGVPRLIARSKENQSDSASPNIIAGNSLLITSVTSIFFAIVLYLGTETLVVYLEKPDMIPVLKAFAFMIPPLAVMQSLASIYQGHQQAKPKAIFEDIAVHIARLVLVALTIGIGLHFQGILYAYISSVWVGFILFAIYAIRHQDKTPLFSIKISYLPTMLVFCLPLLGVGLVNRVTSWVGTLVLGFSQSAEQVALFMAPSRLHVLLLVPMLALGYIYTPIATRLYVQQDWSALKNLYASGTRWVVIFTLPLAMYFIIDAEFIVTLLFGQKYLASAPILQIASFAYCVHTLAGPNVATLVSCGYPKYVFYGGVLAASVAIVLSLALVPDYGAYGAVIGTSVALILSNVFASSVLYKKTGVHPLLPGYFLVLMIIVFSAIVSAWCLVIVDADNWFAHLLTLCFLYMVSILSPILSRSMSETDYELLHAIEKRFLGHSRYTDRLRSWLNAS